MTRSEGYLDSLEGDLFSLWNVKLLETFFSPASKGEEVWLQLDPAELDSIGPELGGDEGFLNSVQAGPPWGTIGRNGRFLIKGTPADLVARVVGLVSQRRASNRTSSYQDPGIYSPAYLGHKAPTYLPFLVALVRSALLTEEGFYAHLRSALKLGPSWGSQQMEALHFAWEDLEAWTKDTGGNFGKFKFRRLGGYTHIGVPRAQSIMSRKDCELISIVFAQIGARPGQQLSPKLVEDVKARAANSPFLTSSFKKALVNPVFNEPINTRLHALFEDWDGIIRSNISLHHGANGHNDGMEEHGEVELCLSLGDGNHFPWRVHWRVPPFRDNGEIILSRGNVDWVAPAQGTEPVTTTNDTNVEAQAAALSALSDSSSQDVEFCAALVQDGSVPTTLGNISLRKAILRVFIWNYDPYTHRDELHEHPLPVNGAAFLLAPPNNSNQLYSWLAREQIAHSLIDTSGLPRGWVLVCLPECQVLTQQQRDDMPDGEFGRDQHRAIRLVGGRSVRRAGIKQYMPYDLPSIELDAPVGTVLQAAGLNLNEEGISKDAAFKSGIRRFHLTPQQLGPKSFIIRAILHDRPLGTATLRVAADSGELVEMGKAFSLDPQGNPTHNGGGLRGVLASTAVAHATPYPFILPSHHLGQRFKPGDLARIQSTAPLQFLDTLAQLGSMAYGPARDQLSRLLAKAHDKASPSLVLLDLRSRGYLEIETNTKGHLARIYAVPPSIYALPIKVGDQPAFGVLGTLRYQQWSSLSESGADLYIYHRETVGSHLDAWRILARDTSHIEAIANASGLLFHKDPALPVADWAATCDDVRARIDHVSGESIGEHVQFAERFNPSTGCFFQVPDVRLSGGPTCELFRMVDRETGTLQCYALATARGGMPRYGFVRDSRWGIWIALHAFADFVKQNYGIPDASPWPIPYTPGTGTLLLPARISLPVVLERALNLCSGSGPEPVEAETVPLPDLQQMALVRKADGVTIAKISCVYQGMANGRWLAYKYVPEEIANLVAQKVSGVIVKA